MFPTKFCSQCGEKIKGNRLRFFAFTAFCSGCKKQARFTHLALVAIFLLLGVSGFLVGRATAPRQPFNFIGEPIDLQSAPHAPPSEATEMSANRNAANTVQQTTAAADKALTMCGAPTKAGRPCRRKVLGGGYCYQHKDKFKAPSNAAQ